MSTLFTINFRREAYQRELNRTRRRVFVLGIWVTYFGALGVLIGLYGLNGFSLTHRLRQIERQTERLRRVQGGVADWKVREAELTDVERYARNPRQWHDRLTRIATLLPPNIRLGTISVNPQNLSAAPDQNKLVITGQLRPTPGEDRMQGVMKFVGMLHDDSLFAKSYANIKLASTKVAEAAGGATEFVIECR